MVPSGCMVRVQCIYFWFKGIDVGVVRKVHSPMTVSGREDDDGGDDGWGWGCTGHQPIHMEWGNHMKELEEETEKRGTDGLCIYLWCDMYIYNHVIYLATGN